MAFCILNRFLQFLISHLCLLTFRTQFIGYHAKTTRKIFSKTFKFA
ncbi:accessory gene regulator B family protein [Streptococcus phocae]